MVARPSSGPCFNTFATEERGSDFHLCIWFLSIKYNMSAISMAPSESRERDGGPPAKRPACRWRGPVLVHVDLGTDKRLPLLCSRCKLWRQGLDDGSSRRQHRRGAQRHAHDHEVGNDPDEGGSTRRPASTLPRDRSGTAPSAPAPAQDQATSTEIQTAPPSTPPLATAMVKPACEASERSTAPRHVVTPRSAGPARQAR